METQTGVVTAFGVGHINGYGKGFIFNHLQRIELPCFIQCDPAFFIPVIADHDDSCTALKNVSAVDAVYLLKSKSVLGISLGKLQCGNICIIAVKRNDLKIAFRRIVQCKVVLKIIICNRIGAAQKRVIVAILFINRILSTSTTSRNTAILN